MPQMPDPSDWSYAVPPDPSSGDIDVVRLYLQDTDPNVRLLSDLELQWLIDQWMPVEDSLIGVAAHAAEIVAGKFAGVVSVSADGVSVNVADIAERYVARAQSLREQAKEFRVGEIDIENLLWDQNIDWSIDPLNFGVGFQDNPEAGRQNYGSERWSAVDYGDRVGWY